MRFLIFLIFLYIFVNEINTLIVSVNPNEGIDDENQNICKTIQYAHTVLEADEIHLLAMNYLWNVDFLYTIKRNVSFIGVSGSRVSSVLTGWVSVFKRFYLKFLVGTYALLHTAKDYSDGINISVERIMFFFSQDSVSNASRFVFKKYYYLFIRAFNANPESASYFNFRNCTITMGQTSFTNGNYHVCNYWNEKQIF
jgi:hypothetical protein